MPKFVKECNLIQRARTMADTHDKETRSYNMSMIKGKNTKPEIIVRKFLHRKGLRYLLNNKNLPGKPDITLPKYKIVIFVNGCFWHGHENCKYFVIPKTRTDWWIDKITKTKNRDNKVKAELEILGWKVITIWECSIKHNCEQNLKDLLDYIK